MRTHATLPPHGVFRSKRNLHERIHTNKVHVNSLPVPH